VAALFAGSATIGCAVALHMTFWIVLTAAADAADATELLLVLLHTGCSMLAMGFCGQLWRWLWANTVNQLQTGVQMLPNCSVRAGMDCCSTAAVC
jgi:hypothetical protein